MKIKKLVSTAGACFLLNTGMVQIGIADMVSKGSSTIPPSDCPNGLLSTPLCLVPNIVDNILQSNIYTVLKYPQRGAVFVGSETEPHLAVNPLDPENMAIAWQQDRTARLGGGLAIVVAIKNKNTGWVLKIIPFTRASGAPNAGGIGSYDRGSDPWLAFDKKGNLYLQMLSFDGLTKLPSGAVLIAKSADKGNTWSIALNNTEEVYEVVSKSGGGSVPLLDKNILSADPALVGPNGDPVLYSSWSLGSKKSDLYFSRSFDGGKTWEAKKKIYTTESDTVGNKNANQVTVGNIKILPDGTIGIFFARYNADLPIHDPYDVRLLRSFDGGNTWEKSAIIVANSHMSQVIDPEIIDANGSPIPIRESAPGVVSADVSKTGDLYVAYLDDVPNNSNSSSIKIVRSTDNGNTWSQPVTVSDKTAFTPNLTVAAKGTVAVGFVDMRNDVLVTGCSYDYLTNTNNCGPFSADVFLKQYNPNLTPIANGETKLTSTSINYRSAPLLFGAAGVIPGGYFMGDYFGLSSSADNFLVAYGNTNSNISCNLLMNDSLTGQLLNDPVSGLPPQIVNLLYIPQNPNAYASNNCNRSDVFFSKVPIK